MRTAIILARAALAEDVEVLRDTVSIEPDRAVVRDRDGTKLTLSRRNLQVDDLLGSVRKVLADVVNRRLEPLTHTSLIQQASGGSTPGLVCWPTSLLGGLWLQFARTMWTYRDQKKCKKCDRWFEQGPKDTRLERVFCSTRCKSQDYRARQQLARVMLRHGMSFEDVSRLIGSDLKTVKRWSAMNTKSPKETK